MQLGSLLPLGDIGGEPAVMREYAEAAEGIGFDFIEALDARRRNAASRPGWGSNTSVDLFHDPSALFGYLAGGVTRKLGFSTGVLHLAQRQAALVAKQAACLDVLCGGRFRLGVGVGWNEAEFVGLNENFPQSRPPLRGAGAGDAGAGPARMSASPVGTTIEDAVGINLRLKSGVPVWFGGHHERTLDCASPTWGDGWMPNACTMPTGSAPTSSLTPPYRSRRPRPGEVGIEVWTSMGSGTEADWAKEAKFWKSAGATHLCLTTTFHRRHHHRLAGTSMTDHVAALKRYHTAVADALNIFSSYRDTEDTEILSWRKPGPILQPQGKRINGSRFSPGWRFQSLCVLCDLR